MKTLLYILLLLFLTTPLLAQKSRFVGDCLNDSIAETFELKLKKSKVDSIISVLYDYNERWTISRRIIIWTHNGQSHIKIVEGCNGIIKDTTYLFNSISLWEYIRVTHFDDVNVPIKSGTYQPSDKFYRIAVHTPLKTFFIVVEDNQRKSSAKYKTPESDSRVMLTNKIDSLVN